MTRPGKLGVLGRRRFCWGGWGITLNCSCKLRSHHFAKDSFLYAKTEEPFTFLFTPYYIYFCWVEMENPFLPKRFTKHINNYIQINVMICHFLGFVSGDDVASGCSGLHMYYCTYISVISGPKHVLYSQVCMYISVACIYICVVNPFGISKEKAEPRCFWERYLKSTYHFAALFVGDGSITLEVFAVFPRIEKLVHPTSNTVTCKSEFAYNLTLSDLGVRRRIRRCRFWGFRSPGSIFSIICQQCPRTRIIQVGEAMSEKVARRMYILMASTGRKKFYCKNAGAESLK